MYIVKNIEAYNAREVEEQLNTIAHEENAELISLVPYVITNNKGIQETPKGDFQYIPNMVFHFYATFKTNSNESS